MSPDKRFILENLAFRIGLNHPGHAVQVGCGNPYAKVLVVQPLPKMPERDAVTGALKNFDMLSDAYRATISIVQDVDAKTNRYYLRELIDIIKPLVIVACGQDVVSFLRQRAIRSFARHTGRKFQVQDLTDYTLYATLNPSDYGFARAPRALKEQGKAEWTKLASIYRALKEAEEKARWSS